MIYIKTWEVYKIGLERPNARFKSVDEIIGDFVVKFNEAGKLVDAEFGNLVYPRYDMEWEEFFREPVDFMTAINSGKRIKPLYNEKMFNFNEADFYMSCLNREYVNGKWYIE